MEQSSGGSNPPFRTTSKFLFGQAISARVLRNARPRGARRLVGRFDCIDPLDVHRFHALPHLVTKHVSVGAELLSFGIELAHFQDHFEPRRDWYDSTRSRLLLLRLDDQLIPDK